MKSDPMRGHALNDLTTTIENCIAGDDGAFGLLVERYQDAAVGYAFSRLGDFHLAQDAAQEAFLAAYRDLPTLTEPPAFPGWLRKIVFKYCDRIKRRRPLPTVPLMDAPEIVDKSQNVEENYLMSQVKIERERLVASALGALSETDRTVVSLFYMGEHSVGEIGSFLQLSQAAVKKRLQRARGRLKERMLNMVAETLLENAPSHSLRFAEAAALMRRVTKLLEDDPRVEAAWLANSFGFTGDSGWSSAWLQVVVKDDAIDDFVLRSVEYASQLAEPLLCAIGPQNAPPGGAYCQALYDGEAGPYEFNWYWQPRTGATIPTGTVIPSEEARPVTHILLNRGGVPSSGEVLRCEYNRNLPDVLRKRFEARTDEERGRDEFSGTIHQFWFMLLISARWIGGAPAEKEPRHLGHIAGLLGEVQKAVGVKKAFPPNRAYSGTAAKLSVLREAASSMEALMPKAAEWGVEVNPAIVPAVRRFMDLIENA